MDRECESCRNTGCEDIDSGDVSTCCVCDGLDASEACYLCSDVISFNETGEFYDG